MQSTDAFGSPARMSWASPTWSVTGSSSHHGANGGRLDWSGPVTAAPPSREAGRVRVDAGHLRERRSGRPHG